MKNQPIRANRPTLIDGDDDVDVSLISSRRERSEAMRNQSSPRDDWHTLMRDNDKDLEVNRLTTREEKSQAMKNQFAKTKNRPILVRQGDDDDGEVKLISTKQQKSQAMKTQSVKADKRSMILFKYIKDKSWTDVLQHLDYYERDAYNWIEEVNDDGTKRWRSLPIHLACEKNPNFEVVNQLLRIYPRSLYERNYGGDLPIHIACRQGAGKDIIKLMLEKGVGTAKETDGEGRLPLHVAACSSDIHLNTIQDIITYNEKAARTPDDFGLLPLHWACTKNGSASTVEAIIKVYPYAVEQKDVYGKLPIDRLEKSSNPHRAKIAEMLSRDVSSWTNAMLSTIVELSSKIDAAEKMKEKSKEKERAFKELIDQNTRSIEEINHLMEKNQEIKDDFAYEIRKMEKSYQMEINAMTHKFEMETMNILGEKDFAEKKCEDLKVLVDELVTQLKIQKGLVDQKEVSRIELKKKSLELLNKIEEAQQEIEARCEDNETLKMDHVKLKYEIEKRDQQIENMAMRRSYDYRDTRERRTRTYGERCGAPSENVDGIPRTFECVRILEDESY